jgi:hypothetical protein
MLREWLCKAMTDDWLIVEGMFVQTMGFIKSRHQYIKSLYLRILKLPRFKTNLVLEKWIKITCMSNMSEKWQIIGDIMWWFKKGGLKKKEGEWSKSSKQQQENYQCHFLGQWKKCRRKLSDHCRAAVLLINSCASIKTKRYMEYMPKTRIKHREEISDNVWILEGKVEGCRSCKGQEKGTIVKE